VPPRRFSTQWRLAAGPCGRRRCGCCLESTCVYAAAQCHDSVGLGLLGLMGAWVWTVSGALSGGREMDGPLRLAPSTQARPAPIMAPVLCLPARPPA
jgi:hypothetical protein